MNFMIASAEVQMTFIIFKTFILVKICKVAISKKFKWLVYFILFAIDTTIL